MRSLRAALRLFGLVLADLLLVPFGLLSRVPSWFGFEETSLRLGAKVQSVWARVHLWVCGVRLVVESEPPREPFLVVANHVSYLDILVLGVLFPGRFVAKSEIADWPLIGPLAKTVGTLFVRQRERKDVVRIGAEMDRTLAAGVSVLLFPEGGASSGARVEPFKSSLFEPAVRSRIPCLPVALHYSTPAEPYGEAWTVCWWGGMGLVRHGWRMFGLPGGIVARARWAESPTLGTERKALSSEVRVALVELFEPIRQEPLPPDLPWPELMPGVDAPRSGST